MVKTEPLLPSEIMIWMEFYWRSQTKRKPSFSGLSRCNYICLCTMLTFLNIQIILTHQHRDNQRVFYTLLLFHFLQKNKSLDPSVPRTLLLDIFLIYATTLIICLSSWLHNIMISQLFVCPSYFFAVHMPFAPIWRSGTDPPLSFCIFILSISLNVRHLKSPVWFAIYTNLTSLRQELLWVVMFLFHPGTIRPSSEHQQRAKRALIFAPFLLSFPPFLLSFLFGLKIVDNINPETHNWLFSHAYSCSAGSLVPPSTATFCSRSVRSPPSGSCLTHFLLCWSYRLILQ